ncbi:MAG TPA: DNA polymerase III subunit delta' [Micropepsaceae bacterium]|jgi:DNA polymerase-3 subunit delta'|nr:DNA polymerase III subunit delta' [Micropepsaceae bacterium]
MSPPRREAQAEEADRIEGQPHPRETYELTGQDAALGRAARAIRSGRPPQAWLLAGPPGIGKATLAYRIARYLLRHGASADGPADLSVSPSDPVSRQIEAGAHPGLLVLRRRTNERGKLKTVLDVEEIRRLGGFFGMTAEAGGWRVAIIDSADDMNDNAANALLKILEEPPVRGLLILISHAPGRLLPTIRSRTQRLDLKPLPDSVIKTALAHLLPNISTEDRATLTSLAEGSLGLALRLADGEGLKLARDAQSLISTRGAPDIPALTALAERIGRSADGLVHFGEFLTQAVSQGIRERARTAEGSTAATERSVETWERLNELYARATGLHLEPRQTVLASAREIAAAKRRGAL